MIDLFSTTQNLLRDAGFSVKLNSLRRQPLVCFEDAALVGFAVVVDNPEVLLSEWKDYENEILLRFGPSFRVAGDKAWNVYCVFLNSAPADADQKRQVSWIEEDLERTRKIAACEISSRDELVRALLPILPIQYQPKLQHEDVTERLRRRVSDIAPQAQHAVLDASVPAIEAVRLLRDRL